MWSLFFPPSRRLKGTGRNDADPARVLIETAGRLLNVSLVWIPAPQLRTTVSFARADPDPCLCQINANMVCFFCKATTYEYRSTNSLTMRAGHAGLVFAAGLGRRDAARRRGVTGMVPW